ncbi:MAG: PHB depolymerase family esterase [Actinomycetota bacterium]
MATGRASRNLVVALVALVLLSTACTGSGRGAAPASSGSARAGASSGEQTSSGTPPAASAGSTGTSSAASRCPVAKLATIGRSDGKLPIAGGSDRRYLLYLPEAYDGRTPLPLVFDFHGYGASADEQLLYSAMAPLAERNHFAIVALNGQGDPPHYNLHPTAVGGEASDIVVVGALLDSLQRTLCLDSRRVYATGMSDGGALSAALGCFAPSRFAAVAPVAALVYDRTCDRAPPVPLMAFRGTADEIVPYAGGRVACCGNPVVHSTKADIASWAKHNGCRPVPALSRRGQVETSTYAGCAGGADVVLHTVIGGGHTWPGAIGLPGLGVTTRDIDASESIWDFFAAHPKP